ncbi:double zinc ribbon and ankyrin repeat-containing protein 1-like [Lytechinus variegatus]|uniref:double zinc ribbon and ankyrin repeat-containing protein 1-like n=1 Tax=Lytechinus variegatus TaxID=7654 RepID=UPI001BB183D3|nr:double zinc ribbon and ankyrin repeat-containing protein 1-like [Lytechinus variegatus]
MAAGAVVVPSIIPLRIPVQGKSKTDIDTNTYIELKSTTPDTDIFYTIDGTKPDPFQTIGQRTTFMYQRPFRLTEGKRTVKALAMARDQTRESFVVSKTFFVEWVREEPDDTDEESLLEAEARNQSPGLKLTASKTTTALLKKVVEAETRRPDSVKGSNYRKPTVGTRFMENRMGTKKPSVSRGQKVGQGKKTPDPASEDDKKKSKKIPENFTQANRLQRQTDFLKCIFCFADRPADPFARFCISCGSPVPALPNARLPPPEPAQLGMCVGCHSMIPLNVSKCLVCEMDVPPQLVPQASVKLQDKLVCNECGTGNPANMQYCVTCEHPLTGANKHLKPTYSQFAAPPEPGKKGRLLCCSKCGRVNNSDARYCDWCGAKPAPTTSLMTCSRCKAANQAYSSFCHSCGVLIEPPIRNDPRNNGITVGGKHTSQVVDQNGEPSWVPMTVPKKEPPKVSVSTMTAGIFYPSNKELIKKDLEQQEAKAKQDAMSDRKVTLTAVSPGKGYWRQQMDHICGHLKAHAQNNTDFRNQIGEPRMGKLVTAAVHEDGYELSLTVCFALRGSKDAMTGKPLGITKSTLLSDVTEGRRNSINSPVTQEKFSNNTKESSSKKDSPKKKTIKKKPVNDKLTPYDKDLLREVGPKGDGDEEEVQRLLDEGADPNSENADGVPVLTITVLNKHFECIPALVFHGADVHKKVGQKGNTALHEAVQLGYDGKQGVVTLLNNGASAKVKNNRDETPAAMATRLGNESIINIFTSTAGQGMLDRIKKQALGKTKTFGEDDF